MLNPAEDMNVHLPCLLCVMQAVTSASEWSLTHRSPTVCMRAHVCVCLIMCDPATSTIRWPRPKSDGCASDFQLPILLIRGPGSSVDIATDYGLDGQWSNPGGDEIFCPSRLALGPTQPPVKWVLGLPGGKVWPGRAADHSPPSSATVMEEYSYTSTHPLGHTGPVTGSLYLFNFLILFRYKIKLQIT